MSAYEELVDEVDKMLFNYGIYPDSADAAARDVIALISRTLETVTPEMADAWREVPILDTAAWHSGEQARREWTAMLRASPLTPP